MRHLSKLPIAAIGAIALVAMAVSTASATHLNIDNWEAGFRIVWFDLKLEAGGREADCPVTLEGTWSTHTVAKVPGTRVGHVLEARVGSCIRGSATVLSGFLPWEVTYQSFSGTLPNITTVTLNIVGAFFRVNIEGVECLASTEIRHPARGIASVNANGEIRTFTAERNAGIETIGGFFCSISGAAHFSNSGSASVRGGTATNTIALI